MLIVEQRVSAASMQESISNSSVLTGAAEYSYQSMSASSMSAMTAESVVSMSSSSHVMEMSAHSHADVSSSSSSSLRLKRGEMLPCVWLL